jgi:putative transposase
MHYRRSNTKGGTFFFTVNLANRSSSILTEHIQLLRNSVSKVRTSHHFTIVAMVVLPEHLHAIWTLPIGDCNYPLRWSLIKSGFSRALRKTETINSSRKQKRERGIWQRRYWEHQIRNEEDLARHIDYIHINPVKHGYTDTAVKWPYSSIHRYIRQGVLPYNWSVDLRGDHLGYGES